MKDKLTKIANFADRFVQSDYFIVFNALIVLIGWAFDIWVPMLCIMIALSVLPLFFFKGTKHILSTLLMFTLIISSYRHKLDDFAPLLSLVAVLFVGIAFNLIRFRRDFRPLTPTRIKGFHCSLIALVIPFALGGVTSPTENVYAVLTALALIVLCALGYSFFVVTNQDRPDKEKLMDYVIKTLFVMGVVICGQMAIYFASCENIDQVLAICTQKSIALGWAGSNNVAPTLAMAIPATLYLCIKKNKATPILVVFAVIEYILIICTGCRGEIILTTLLMAPMILYVIVKSQNKLAFGISLSIMIAIVLVVVAFFGDKVSPMVTAILNRGLSSAGRTDGLYPKAIEAFKMWPIFGSGWDYKLGASVGNKYTPYFYHSTVLQIMATMGVCGLIGFAFFYFFRYRTYLALRKNPAALALMLSTFLFDAYGMLDTGFFGPTFFIMLLVQTLVVEINLPENKCRAFAGHNPFKEAFELTKTCILKIKQKVANHNTNKA